MGDDEGLFTDEELRRGYVSRSRLFEILRWLTPVSTWRERGVEDARKILVKAGEVYDDHPHRNHLLFTGNIESNGEFNSDKWLFSSVGYQTLLRVGSTTGKTNQLNGDSEKIIRIIKGEARLWR